MVGVQVRMLETYYDAAEEGDPEDDGTRGLLASAELSAGSHVCVWCDCSGEPGLAGAVATLTLNEAAVAPAPVPQQDNDSSEEEGAAVAPGTGLVFGDETRGGEDEEVEDDGADDGGGAFVF